MPVGIQLAIAAAIGLVVGWLIGRARGGGVRTRGWKMNYAIRSASAKPNLRSFARN